MNFLNLIFMNYFKMVTNKRSQFAGGTQSSLVIVPCLISIGKPERNRETNYGISYAMLVLQ